MKEHQLVTLGKEWFSQTKSKSVYFLENKEINSFLNDLENFPQAYVLACVMDRQITAERAWTIPWIIKEDLNSFDINILGQQSLAYYEQVFLSKSLHRFNKRMAKIFYSAVHRIIDDYHGDASLIWRNNPSSASVVYKFLQFEGCGIKIATMATNILASQFRIPFSDYYSIDISPDVHIRRVLKRTGLVESNATVESIIYKARELNPDFPGIIDFSCWEIGRNFCKPNNPICSKCPIESSCKKVIG